jgi:ABC-type lipoprotein release transport system permease subunit
VLRTLGFVGRDLSALVRWEGTTFAVIGIVLGVPLGVITGRVVWNEVATGIGVAPSATIPVLALLAIAAATLAVALLAAAVPGRRARRVHPATTLAVDT